MGNVNEINDAADYSLKNHGSPVQVRPSAQDKSLSENAKSNSAPDSDNQSYTPQITVSLVRGYSGLVHKPTCYAIRRSWFQGIAPEIDEGEVPAFLKARRLEPCRACFPVVRDD